MASGPNKVQLSATDVMRDLECLICMEVPSKPPIYQCEEGHILCEVCYDDRMKVNKTCPTCNVALAGIRCRMAEKMISKLPTRCKYSGDGCDVELMSDELPKHEVNCPVGQCVKTIDCFELLCKDEVKVAAFLKHQIDEHDIKTQDPNKAFIDVPKKYKKLSTSKNLQCAPVHFKIQNEDFYLMMIRTKKEKLWYLWVYAMSFQVCEKNKYKLEMRSEDLKEKYEYVGEFSPLDKYPVKHMISDKFCDGLILNDTIVEKFLTKKYAINFKMKLIPLNQSIDKIKNGNTESIFGSNDDDSQTDSGSNGSKKTKRRGITKRNKSYLSNDLASIVGRNRASRKYVLKQMWAYVRNNNLQDPSNKQFANCDEKLRRVIGKNKVKCMLMKKYLDAHMGDTYQDEANTVGKDGTVNISNKPSIQPIKFRSNKDLFGDGRSYLISSGIGLGTNIIGKKLWTETDELSIIEEIRQLCEQQEELETKVRQDKQGKIKINTKATPMAMNKR